MNSDSQLRSSSVPAPITGKKRATREMSRTVRRIRDGHSVPDLSAVSLNIVSVDVNSMTIAEFASSAPPGTLQAALEANLIDIDIDCGELIESANPMLLAYLIGERTHQVGRALQDLACKTEDVARAERRRDAFMSIVMRLSTQTPVANIDARLLWGLATLLSFVDPKNVDDGDWHWLTTYVRALALLAKRVGDLTSLRIAASDNVDATCIESSLLATLQNIVVNREDDEDGSPFVPQHLDDVLQAIDAAAGNAWGVGERSKKRRRDERSIEALKLCGVPLEVK